MNIDAMIKHNLRIRPDFQAKKFHDAFNIPRQYDLETLELRYKLLKEEFEEYEEAMEKLRENPDDIDAQVELLDAMCDMTVINYGTADVFDWDMQVGMERVFDSNMSKLDDNGNPLLNGINCPMDETRPKGKVLKSNNFFEPNLRDLVEKESK